MLVTMNLELYMEIIQKIFVGENIFEMPVLIL